jgi:hypothetical protein
MHPIILAIVIAAASPDASFVQQADQDLVGQYALATLAASHASDPRIKALGRQIAANASSASRYLDEYAKAHGIALSGKPDMRADVQYGNISSLHGKSFDSQFVEDIRTDESFQSSDFQSPGVSDPSLRRFAGQEYDAMKKAGKTATALGG